MNLQGRQNIAKSELSFTSFSQRQHDFAKGWPLFGMSFFVSWWRFMAFAKTVWTKRVFCNGKGNWFVVNRNMSAYVRPRYAVGWTTGNPSYFDIFKTNGKVWSTIDGGRSASLLSVIIVTPCVNLDEDKECVTVTPYWYNLTSSY